MEVFFQKATPHKTFMVLTASGEGEKEREHQDYGKHKNVEEETDTAHISRNIDPRVGLSVESEGETSFLVHARAAAHFEFLNIYS